MQLRRPLISRISLAAGALVGLLALPAPSALAQTGTMMQAPAAPTLSVPTQRSDGIATANPHITSQLVDPTVQFDNSERWIIPRYFEHVRERQRRAARFRNYPRDLPAGLTAPPSTGDVLPATVLAGMEPLPKPLTRELPAPRPDTRRYIAGKDVVLVRASSGKVLDVLSGVLR